MSDFREYLRNRPTPGMPGITSDKMMGEAMPPIQKAFPEEANLKNLVPINEINLGDVPLIKAINERRTRRLFSEKALTIEELSFLLWATQGVQQVVRSGMFTLRTVPSFGGMHPFETYLLVDRIEGLEPGLYRYLALEHKLLPIPVGEEINLSEKIVEACNNQDFVVKGAVVIIWSARPYRSEWRNGENSLKDILISAGHICQNLYLACEAIGAGVSPVLTYQQELLDAFIGVDGEEELAVYLATVGKVP